MQFLAPSALIFLLIIPVIIIFYLLRQKKQEQVVSSTLLWQQVLADTLAQTPWQRLRRNLLLFLQIMVALLLVLALLRPYLVRMQEGGQDLFMLLDTSASMAVVEDKGTRMDLAKAEMAKLIRGQKPGTKISLIAVGPVPQVMVNATGKASVLLSQLQEVEPGFAQANLEPALSLVAALLQKGSRARTVFFSDGGVILPEEPIGLPDFQYRKVGRRDDNLAIGAFSLQEGAQGALALTRIDNYGAREAAATVKLMAGEKLLDVRAVKVTPGKAAHLFWPVPAGTPFLTAQLDIADSLAADNMAWVVPRQSKQVKVLLVTPGNIFLEQVLKLNPLLEVHKVAPAGYADIRSDYQLYVLDSFWPAQPPPGEILVFNPPAVSGLVEKEESAVSGQLQALAEQPLLDHVSWADVHIAKSKGLKMSGEWQPLLTGGDKAIISVGKNGAARAAVFGFDLHQSDLPLRPAFPILIQNMLNWLIPAGTVRESQITAGAVVDLAVRPQAEQVWLIKPDGARVPLAPPFPVRKVTDTGRPGLYKVEQITGKDRQADYLAVNFYAPRESEVKPLERLQLGSLDIKAQKALNVNRELWPWLVLAALAGLSLEWWVYLRGH